MDDQTIERSASRGRPRRRRREKDVTANPEVPQVPPTHELKDALLAVILVLFCGLAVQQKMEFLAISTLVALTAIIYKYRARQVMDVGYELLKKTRTAKIGDVEVAIEQKLIDYSRLLTKQAEWIRLILSDMTAEQISLLLAIYRAGRYETRNKDALRALRARALIQYNAPTLTESTEVWLSELGSEVASRVLEPIAEEDEAGSALQVSPPEGRDHAEPTSLGGEQAST